MKKNSPFLLLMPSYNHSHYIQEAVQSVLAQNDPDWELWILDNSTDSTPEVMKEFNDHRIHFYHTPERMDPGSCLNWMLERARGEIFSYIHTDNNLDPSYVRTLRKAIGDKEFGLAYCNMRTINEDGKCIGIFIRGEFTLARLFSTDTLGAPFAATVKLAKEIGGFNSDDFADDVRFCVSAYGIAEYSYVKEPLLDYRIHSSSRSEAAGGYTGMIKVFTELMPKLLPVVQSRGINPLLTLEESIMESLDDMELYLEDYWHRKLSKISSKWWHGKFRFDNMFSHGLIDLPGLGNTSLKPDQSIYIKHANENKYTFPWQILAIKIKLRKANKHLRHMSKKTTGMLLPWAKIKFKIEDGKENIICLKSIDFRTVWAAKQLEIHLGCKPVIDRKIEDIPKWLKWEKNSTDKENHIDFVRNTLLIEKKHS